MKINERFKKWVAAIIFTIITIVFIGYGIAYKLIIDPIMMAFNEHGFVGALTAAGIIIVVAAIIIAILVLFNWAVNKLFQHDNGKK